jgi:hypothetical protein
MTIPGPIILYNPVRARSEEGLPVAPKCGELSAKPPSAAEYQEVSSKSYHRGYARAQHRLYPAFHAIGMLITYQCDCHVLLHTPCDARFVGPDYALGTPGCRL